WLFGPNARTNTNWTNPIGKYLTLRPRPIDQKRNPADPNEPELFPYPEDEGGDVKNLVGAPGTLYFVNGPNGPEPRYATNASYWIHLGFPVQVAPNGRKYKPLFAPFIIDLDSRINLSVHGNANVQIINTRHHTSNQGWGRWEVNPARLADPNDTNRQQE